MERPLLAVAHHAGPRPNAPSKWPRRRPSNRTVHAGAALSGHLDCEPSVAAATLPGPASHPQPNSAVATISTRILAPAPDRSKPCRPAGPDRDVVDSFLFWFLILWCAGELAHHLSARTLRSPELLSDDLSGPPTAGARRRS